MKNLSVNKSLYTEYLKKRKFPSKVHLVVKILFSIQL